MQSSIPKISIIIPIYNTEQYLQRCLESLNTQTLEDIEIICVNDGSTDNSAQILKEFAQKDIRVKVISQKNQGQSAARNKGMELAQGEFIGFLDADDWAEPSMLEKLYENAKKLDSDVSMCSISTFDEKKGEYIAHDPYMSLDVFPKNFENRAFAPHETFEFIFRICVVPWNKIYRREFLMKNGIKFLPNLNFEDNVFCLETILASTKISIIKEPLVIYRRESETSYSSSKNHDEKKLDFFKVFALEEKVLKEKGAYHGLKKYFKAYKKDTLTQWYGKIQNPTVKRQYFQKLVVAQPLFLLDGLRREIKIKLGAARLQKILKTQKVVFWGASLFLRDFLSRFLNEAGTSRTNIVGVVDKASSRLGEDFCGYKITSPESLKTLEFDAVVPSIINIHNFDKILKNELDVLGMDKEVLKIC